MACVKGPTIFPPVFPAGITLPTITLPVPSALNLCCRIALPFPAAIALPAIPIPGAVLAVIEDVFDAINAVLDEIEISCPLD